HFLDGIHGHDSDDGGPGLRGFRNYFFHQPGINEWAHGVVHRHEIRIGTQDRESILDRLLARLASLHHTHWFLRMLLMNQAARPVHIFGPERNDDLSHGRAVEELADGVD